MHHDPLISARKTALTRWGHSWVILSVILEFPLPQRLLFFPADPLSPLSLQTDSQT
jgi:hypothetical protein